MELFKMVMNDPYMMPVAVAISVGLAAIWKAITAAIVRALNRVATDHDGDDDELVTKIRDYDDQSTVRSRVESSVLSRMPGAVIQRQVVKHKEQSK